MESETAKNMDMAMYADRGFYAFSVKTGAITDWHGALLSKYPPYSTGEVVKIDEKTAKAVESGRISREKFAYALRMGATVEEFLASLKQDAKPAPKAGAKAGAKKGGE